MRRKYPRQDDTVIADACDMIEGYSIGNIVPVTCGHTGMPSFSEVHMMEQHMQLSGFMKMTTSI